MVPGADTLIFGKNQLGEDSTGLPGRGFFFDFEHVPFQKNTYIDVFGIKNEKDAHRILGKIGGILSPQSLFWTLLVKKRVFARKWQNHGQSPSPRIAG